MCQSCFINETKRNIAQTQKNENIRFVRDKVSIFLDSELLQPLLKRDDYLTYKNISKYKVEKKTCKKLFNALIK